MHRYHFAIAASIAALSAASVSAATFVSTTITSTPTAPGFVTYTLTATSNAGNIIGFNFDNPFGITAEGGAQFRQVNPFGSPSVLNDLPEALYVAVGSHIQADTHFLVKSADGIAINMAESATALRGAYNVFNPAAATPSMTFAQVVLPIGLALPRIFGSFTVATSNGNILEDVDAFFIPEPTNLVMAGVSLVGMVAVARRRK